MPFNGHFPGKPEPGLASCALDSHSPLRLTATSSRYLNTIPPGFFGHLPSPVP